MRTIRAANANDVDLIAALGRQTYREHFAHLWTETGLQRFFGEHFDRPRLERELFSGGDVRYVLAFADEQPVGFAKMNHDRPLPAGEGARGLELQKIYFTKAAAGRGHGGALLAYVIALAEQLRAPLLWLDVLQSNQRAVRFYEHHGFVRHGEVSFSTDTQVMGMWVMRRALG